MKYEVRKPNLVPYFNKVQKLKDQFTLIEVHQVPRCENVKADAPVGLATLMALPENDKVTITITEQKLLPPLDTHQAVADCFQVSRSKTCPYENSFRDWREPFIDYIMVFCPTTSKTELALKGVRPDFIMIFYLKPYTEGHWSFVAVPIPKGSERCTKRGPCKAMWRSSNWTKFT